MSDLTSHRMIYLKGFLFLLILITAGGLILIESPSLKIGVLLVLVIWSSARLYYFMFYVIEKYVDSEYKFAGIYSFILYQINKRRE